MTRFDRLLRVISLVLAGGSLGFFIFNAVVFSNLQPQMVAFEPLEPAKENLFLWTGAGLLVYLAFCLNALFLIARSLQRGIDIGLQHIGMVILLILSFLFVFSDMALLNDIGKQYRDGLAQPEWLLVVGLMCFQALTAVVYVLFQRVALKCEPQQGGAVIDSNIYLVAQYIGLLCGFMGLSFSLLGYLFPRAWNLTVHTISSMLLYLLPYGLAVGFWIFTKLQEKKGLQYDEKQRQDVGKSSFLTLIVTTVIMVAVFILNYGNLGGITSMLWLPIWLFSTLMLFSLGNIYFSWRE